MSLQRRHVNQNRVACPVAHALFWDLRSVRIMKRVLQETGAATSSQENTKDIASGSSAVWQDTCWKYSKGVQQEASHIYWYLATCNFCAHAGRLRLKTS